MLTNIESYHRPQSVEETVKLLSEDEGRVILAGGTRLIPDEIRDYKEVVDIQELPLEGLEFSDDTLTIGSLSRIADIQKNEDLDTYNLSVLRKAALDRPSQLKRNQSTIGGELVSSEGGSELATVLLALDAQLNVRGPEGERTMELSELYAGDGTVTLDPAEIITSIYLPLPDEDDHIYYRRLSRTHNDISLVNFAFYGRPNGQGFERTRIAVGGVDDRNRRMPKTEAFAETVDVSDNELKQELAVPLEGDVDFQDDFRASAEYRMDVLKVFVKRALIQEEGVEDPFK